MNKIGIYKIVNIISGKCYVGQSINMGKRWKRHQSNAIKGKKTALYDAIRSYGINNFRFEIIEECTKEELNSLEHHWIKVFDSLQNGYNLIDGGTQNRRELSDITRMRMSKAQLGKKHTAESKAKLSAASKGRVPSEETRAKISAIHKGKVVSEETRRKISEAKQNISDETRIKMSLAQIGKKHTPESKLKMSQLRKGKPKSDEHKANIALALIGNRNRLNSKTASSIVALY